MRGSPAVILRIVLAGLAISTGMGVFYALTQRAAFVASFPGARSTTIYVSFLLVAGGGLVTLAGLWYWRRWAVLAYAALVAAGVGLDVFAHAPAAHIELVIAAAAVMFPLIYLNRDRYRQRAGSALT